MTWEWLAPAATVIGASITAGFGGWLGGCRSRRDQETQHRFEREQALTERGSAKAEDAIAALRYLDRHAKTVAEWTDKSPEGELDDTHEQHDRLGRSIEYLGDANVRRDITLIHDVIGDSWIVVRYGDSDIDNAVPMIRLACRQGLAALGRYLRGEPWETSPYLATLRAAYDSGYDNLEQEWQDSISALEDDVLLEHNDMEG